MSLIAIPLTELVLTAQDLDEWPEGTHPQALIAHCTAGQPISFSVPSLKRAVPISRHLARLWLSAQNVTDEDTRYTTLLVISELMTNALEHSGSTRISSHLHKAGDHLHVEVRDQGRTTSTPQQPLPVHHIKESGRGLELVTELAEDWGVETDSNGNCTVLATLRINP
ncbi:ATP-binding protein [Streptomyces sp. NPDC058405]|uniref:ATP-binding protein n=1 Tax=Streptomyces sp. NPDC058405 TaxID=3346482 RepID=UPI003664746B